MWNCLYKRILSHLWLRWKNLSQLLRAWILLLQKILGHPRSLTGENSTESITLSYFLYESQSSKKFGDNCYNHKKCLSPAVIVRQGNTWNLIICSRFGRQRMVSHNTQIIGGNWFIGRVTSMNKARLLEIFNEESTTIKILLRRDCTHKKLCNRRGAVLTFFFL